MDKMITLEFAYGSKTYYALIRTKMNKQEKQYYITIMNGSLERILYGNHIIIEEDGVLQSATNISKSEVGELRRCVAMALCHHLQAKGFLISLQDYSKLN